MARWVRTSDLVSEIGQDYRQIINIGQEYTLVHDAQPFIIDTGLFSPGILLRSVRLGDEVHILLRVADKRVADSIDLRLSLSSSTSLPEINYASYAFTCQSYLTYYITFHDSHDKLVHACTKYIRSE
jgi:hypothetical protein